MYIYVLTQLLSASAVVNDEAHRLRIELFEYLTTFFPEIMTPPKANLVDLVQI